MRNTPISDRGPRAGSARFGDRLARQLLWMIGVRLVVVTSVLLPAFLIDLSADGAGISFSLLLETAGIAYLSSLIYLAVRLWPRVPVGVQAYLQFAGDLVLVSYLVAHTGGAISPFSSLYLIVITVASALLRRRSGVFVATAAWLSFAAVGWALADGQAGGFVAEPISTERLGFALSIHLMGFYAVAMLTALLARDVARAERQLEEASEDLAELESFHRYVVASVSSGLVTTDVEGNITTINPAGRAILARSEDDLLGMRIQDTGLFDQATWNRLTAAPADRLRSEAEIELHGETRVVGYSLAELLDHEGARRGFTLVFQDLTPWRRLQEQLRIRDRMAVVGELAAGLAHEIGNPLAAISGSVQMLSTTPGRTESETRLLRIVLQESQRLDRTIKDFLAYARPAPRRPAPFDIAALLVEHVELLRNSREVQQGHRIELDLGESAVELVADRDRIQQILWNLSRNALRAMPEGGRLRLVGRRHRDRYTIEVEDNGRGMTPEQKAKLFQPYHSFFDGGTGIGMAIVYRIVEEHEGEIEVDSGGQGTRITVHLPLSRRPIEPLEARAG